MGSGFRLRLEGRTLFFNDELFGLFPGFAEFVAEAFGFFNVRPFGQTEFGNWSNNDGGLTLNGTFMFTDAAAVAAVFSDKRAAHSVHDSKFDGVVGTLFIANETKSILLPDETAIPIEYGRTDFRVFTFFKV